MREWFKAMFDDKIPKMYKNSALGTKICFYALGGNPGAIMAAEIDGAWVFLRREVMGVFSNLLLK